MEDSEDDWNGPTVPFFTGSVDSTQHMDEDEACGDDWNAPTAPGSIAASASASSSHSGGIAASASASSNPSHAIVVYSGGEQDAIMAEPEPARPPRHKLAQGFKAVKDTINIFSGGCRHASATSRSMLTGKSRKQLGKRLRASAFFVYGAVRKMSSDIIESAVKRRRQPSPEECDRNTAVVYMRRRKYDEAQQEVVADVPDIQGVTPYSIAVLDGRGHIDQVKAKHKLVIAELAWAVILRKANPPSVKYLTLIGKLPAHIQSVDRNNGESMNATMQIASLPCDPFVRDNVERIVDIHCHDEGGPNMRFEKKKSIEAEPHETDVEVLCLAHKKAQCNGEGNRVQKPVDSRLIRLQLSVTGPMTKFIFSSARTLLRDRLTIVPPETVTVADENYMKATLDLCIPKVEGYDVYRRHVIENLFFGRWRKHDKFRIVDRMQLGFERLLGLLCSVGIQLLFPRRSWPVLMRKNWTGADVSVDSILLGSLIFGIFQAAYIGAVHMVRSKDGISLLPYLPGYDLIVVPE